MTGAKTDETEPGWEALGSMQSVRVRKEAVNAAAYPDIDLAAVKGHKDGALAVWYVARALDTEGRGLVSRTALQEIGRRLKLSRPTLRRHLAAGAGTFWCRGQGGLFLSAPWRVAHRLGVESLRASYEFDLGSLALKTGARRSLIALRAVAAIRGPIPTSNATVGHLAGRRKRTVQRWTRSVSNRVPKVRNFALLAPAQTPELTRRMLGSDPRLRLVRYMGKTWIAERLGGSWTLDARKVGGLRLRRHRRRLWLARKTSENADGGNVRRSPWCLHSAVADAELLPHRITDRGVWVPIGWLSDQFRHPLSVPRPTRPS